MHRPSPKRRLFDRVFAGLCAACTLLAGSSIAGIVLTLLVKGFPALSWEFLSFTPDRGIGFHFLGTLILIVTALFVAAPLATGIAVFHGVYVPRSRPRTALKIVFYAFNGVPSILFGIFGFWFFVKFLGWDRSWLAGGIVLGFMILPSIVLALAERIESLPAKYVEAAFGLGLRRSQVIWSVVLPQSMSGLVTGSLLGLARAAGEVAPVMFTAAVFSGVTWPKGVRDSPVLALPYHIFVLAQDTFRESAKVEVWATAVILVGLVATLALLALPARIQIHEEANHG